MSVSETVFIIPDINAGGYDMSNIYFKEHAFRKMNVTNRSIDNLINNNKNIKVNLNKIQQNVKKKLDPKNLKKIMKKEVAVFDNVILNKFLIHV